MCAERKQASNYQTRIIKELEQIPDTSKTLWSEFEEGIMKKYYQKKGARALAKTLKRPIYSIHNKAQGLGLSIRGRTRI